MVFGYPKEFNQAILNIISNGADAFDEKSENRVIRIEAKRLNDKARLTIYDNAGGIESEIIKRVFEPYVSSKGDNGTGLGLYITKKIIEEHFGGTISVENEDGGAKFVIELKGV